MFSDQLHHVVRLIRKKTDLVVVICGHNDTDDVTHILCLQNADVILAGVEHWAVEIAEHLERDGSDVRARRLTSVFHNHLHLNQPDTYS